MQSRKSFSRSTERRRCRRAAGRRPDAAAARRAAAARIRSPRISTTRPRPRRFPAEAMLASLGCGNPTALAELQPGEVVLDLGSGGGIDVLLSAKRVGPTGKAYGLDMTDEMLALARENQAKSGLTNVEFLKGEIEHIPLPDNSVDVIISNCVINLSADKDRVIAEAFRVLKPGGRFAVSDVVVRGEDVPAAVRQKHGALGRLRRWRARGEQLPGQVGQGGIREYRRRTDPNLPRRGCAAVSRRGRALGCRHRCANRRPFHERVCPRAKAWRREGLLRTDMLLVNLGVVVALRAVGDVRGPELCLQIQHVAAAALRRAVCRSMP